MYSEQAKKMLIINILDILRKYSNEEHRLSQKDIADILKKEYGMTVERKAVKRNLTDLLEAGYPINYSEAKRMVSDKVSGNREESFILSDFYIDHDLSDSELRLLIDSLLFSKHIPYNQCKALIEKLENLSDVYFSAHVKHIRTVPDAMPKNRQLFYTIEVLDEAISKEKQVSFLYNECGTDFKLHPRKSSDGNPRRYIINPYQIAAANGKYYLICNYDKYDSISNYRLDRITDIKLLDSPVKPTSKVKGLEKGFDLPKHMAEHIYMFTGGSETVKFRLKKYLVGEVIDWFGNDIVFSDETEDSVTAKVYVNHMAMRKWALQYALHTKVLSPASLAEEVKQDLQSAMKNYEIEG